MATPTLPPPDWFMQQKFPELVTAGHSWPDCLLKLQSTPFSVQCNIACGQHTLQSTEDCVVKFEVAASPIGSFFMIELQLHPLPSRNATGEDHRRNREERMFAVFCTYDPAGPQYSDRTPYIYTSNQGNVAPAGPLSFSQQLYDVRYTTADKGASSLPTHSGMELSLQHCFSWRSTKCVKFAFSRPLNGYTTAATNAAKTFRAMIDYLTSTSTADITVITRAGARLGDVYWPWFAAVPSPVPESYWPWLHKPDPAKPLDVMQFPPNQPFERSIKYVDCALGVREKNWFTTKGGPVQDAKLAPTDLKIAKLNICTRFTDERQYLAYTLGAFGYEEVNARKALDRWVNGEHICDIMTDSTLGSRKYMLLLNIRPPRSNDLEMDSDASLPAENERVDIVVTSNNEDQLWSGHVVRIPQKYAKYGRNVAIIAEAPPSSGGRVDTSWQTKAEFHFGHYGSPSGPTIGLILELMTQPTTIIGGPWLKQVLLSQDLYETGNEGATSSSLPPNWKSVVNEVCERRTLNKEQVQVVRHYFTHRVTVCRGPPGTGKSTLIDAILEIEERLGQKFWVATESNAAVDILAKKLCTRKGQLHPLGLFRIKPAFEEKLEGVVRSGHMDIIAIPGVPTTRGAETAAEAIAYFLQSAENVERTMALDATIKARFNQIHRLAAHPKDQLFEHERDILVELQHAFIYLYGMQYDEGPDVDVTVERQRREKKFFRVLRKLQRNYVTCARGIFSTAAAATGPLLSRWAPKALIMDEASQFMEARAVGPIIQGLKNKNLSRIILIGDDFQLPPTLLAPRNPFSVTGQLSLFERLIKAGWPVLCLREQFRMHPHISSICNTVIYSGELSNGANTTTRPDIAKFQDYMQGYAKHAKVRVGKTSAVVISPVEHKNWHWGSQKARGSTSRHNVQTARMVFMKAYYLIIKGRFAARDIKIITFYLDQVALLKALFADLTIFDGVEIETIDTSQGSEAPVVIIDLVVLGAAGPDGMGFLNKDRRRFNVAMSRPQSGRIVIAQKGMIAVERSGKEANAGVWNQFFKEARERDSIIDGNLLNGDFDDAEMKARFTDVSRTWASYTQGKAVGHANIRESKNEQTASVARPSQNVGSVIATFVGMTGATDAHAEVYLRAAYGVLHVALDAYLREHGSDDIPVENI
ncbi:hypothetical protein B0A55_03455 [Friedmanniomyces simplex]|uniref:DNA2/NAM7 helicase-like C-terminal domain-containing protein n=1 Tax=Friedmanniomyces simplex TaxID=329884 RepID=A0A4U0XUB1_9PEZI|nr:hypothetical protein B0A55_03455 [Friedmanniomyces simplex]